MTTRTELERYRWLRECGRNILDRHIATGGLSEKIKQLDDWQKAMLDQQLELRWRSRNRFPFPENWLWTERSLSQSSDYWCAQHKATLFPSGAVVIDACCGAGSDLVALAARGQAQGIDFDPVLVGLAQDNARAHGLAVAVSQQNLPRDWSSGIDWLHIDPDRRARGTRTSVGDEFSPTLAAVLAMSRDTKGAMIKLAPLTRFEPELGRRIESETERVWLGNRGECRQQLLLTGQLTQAAGSRRAVLCEQHASSDRGQMSQVAAADAVNQYYAGDAAAKLDTTAVPLQYVYDLHSVLHASELQAAWASEHGLIGLGDRHGYFTSKHASFSPWSQCFEVLDTIAWDDRKVRSWLRNYRAGSVEVKCRLIKLDASIYQRRYSTAAGRDLALLITRLAGRARAIITRRIEPSLDA